jgi:hypothetical protein
MMTNVEHRSVGAGGGAAVSASMRSEDYLTKQEVAERIKKTARTVESRQNI